MSSFMNTETVRASTAKQEQRGTTCESRSVGVGFACEACVSGDDLPSKDNILSLQPIDESVVDTGMTMDEILAFSPKPQKGRRLTTRRMNIALNPEALNALTITYDGAIRPERRRSEGLRVFSGDGSPSPENKPSPVIPRTPTQVVPPCFGVLTEEHLSSKDNAPENESASFLVYSNGLLLTPDGELVKQEDYNLSNEEINRQLKVYLDQTWCDTDECIISGPKNAGGSRFVFSTPPKIPGLVRSECVRIDLLNPCVAPTELSPLGIYANVDDNNEYVPANLFMNEFCHH